MRMRWVLISFCLFVPAAVFASGICEQGAKKNPATAAVNLLKEGFKEGLLSLEQLHGLAAMNPHTWPNPFAPHARTIEGNSLFHGFNRVLSLLQKQNPEEAAKELNSALKSLNIAQEKVQIAREQTKRIFGDPEYIRTLRFPKAADGDYRRLRGVVAKGTFEGRPIFVADFESGHFSQPTVTEVLFDPFNSNEKERRKILKRGPPEQMDGSLVIFERNGHPYLIALGRDFAYDIKNKMPTTRQALGLKDAPDFSKKTFFHAVNNSAHKIVSMEKRGVIGDVRTEFQFFDLTHAQQTSFELNCVNPQFHTYGQRSFITCLDIPNESLLVIDVDKEEVLPAVEIGDQIPQSMPNTLVYEENGVLNAALLLTNTLPRGLPSLIATYSLTQVRLDTGTLEKKLAEFPVIPDLKMAMINGRPGFLVQYDDNLFIGDFNGTRPQRISLGEDTKEWGTFTRNGETFIHHLKLNGESEIFNLMGTVLSKQNIGQILSDSYYFIYQNEAYVVHFQKNFPKLYALTVEEKK